MNYRAEPMVVRTRLVAVRDERLLAYCIIATGALAATLLSGQPALVGLAVPFMLALAIGLRRRGPVEVVARVVLDTDRVLEADIVRGRIELVWEGKLDARMIMHRPHGSPLRNQAGALTWVMPAAPGIIDVPFAIRATRWGRKPAGEIWVRLSAPFGLLTWTGRVVTMPALRVLPAGERLTRLVDPPEARAVLGAHLSRRRGEGHEFADLRPYAPGDRLRNLNWRATARHRRPFVSQQHQEVSGDVVILVDAFGDGSGGSDRAIARAARAGWALASAHLRANDRVGLVGLGSGIGWLPPAGGRRAMYQLLETLLAVGGQANEGDLTAQHVRRAAIPSAALLIALTHLQDLRTIRLLQGLRARGRAVAVAMVGTSDLLGPPSGPAEVMARRLWSVELEGRRRHLAGLGIPVVPLTGGGGIAPTVTALRRARRAVRVRERR